MRNKVAKALRKRAYFIWKEAGQPKDLRPKTIHRRLKRLWNKGVRPTI